jgi:Secretion system C-terminal sorting domain/Glycosyl hydrolases family 39
MKIKIILFIVLTSTNFRLLAQESITINAGVDSGLFRNYTGFLHGETNLENMPTALDLVRKIKPKYWRNADWHLTQNLAHKLATNTTLVVSDFYAAFKGGYDKAKPWLNWVEYETFVKSLVNQYQNAGIAPNFWDVWNEPNDASYWSGNLAQLIECFKITRRAVKAINPKIKLVGPSINSYNALGIAYLLDSLAANGVTLEAVSWHEFGLPDSLVLHTNDFKNRRVLNPTWGNPEIHINEYSPQQTNQIPAYRLAWLYHLEQNNVDWANTACWNNFDGTTNWSNCSVGLNGLFWQDEKSPLPVYWVARAYADMLDGKRVFCNRSDPKTLALSSKNDVTKDMRIIVGRYYSINDGRFLPTDLGKDSSNVTIKINNYPYQTTASIPLLIQKIPKGNLIFQNSPFNAPITVFSGTTNVLGGTINISLKKFLDGDVYIVQLNTPNILAVNDISTQNDFEIYPNPNSNLVTIRTKEKLKERLFILNSVGQILSENTLNGDYFTIDTSKFASGIYFIKIGQTTKKMIKE